MFGPISDVGDVFIIGRYIRHLNVIFMCLMLWFFMLEDLTEFAVGHLRRCRTRAGI